jgi:DNA-binding XRE family transcriptional regulator
MVDEEDEEIKRVIDELKAWCQEEHGRNVEVAEKLGVSRQLVSDWFKGRAIPSLKNWLKIQRFLRKQMRRRKRRIT